MGFNPGFRASTCQPACWSHANTWQRIQDLLGQRRHHTPAWSPEWSPDRWNPGFSQDQFWGVWRSSYIGIEAYTLPSQQILLTVIWGSAAEINQPMQCWEHVGTRELPNILITKREPQDLTCAVHSDSCCYCYSHQTEQAQARYSWELCTRAQRKEQLA